MERALDLGQYSSSAQTLLTADDVRRLIEQSRNAATEHQRPINIQINLGEQTDRGRHRRDEAGFGFFRSKLVWVAIALMLSVGAAYARTRYVCQSFKDSGRFYYGMSVDRCVNVLIKQPFDLVGNHLETINRSY